MLGRPDGQNDVLLVKDVIVLDVVKEDGGSLVAHACQKDGGSSNRLGRMGRFLDGTDKCLQWDVVSRGLLAQHL
ncbi:hypothetical protein D9M70_633250 [compost metagenome]